LDKVQGKPGLTADDIIDLLFGGPAYAEEPLTTDQYKWQQLMQQQQQLQLDLLLKIGGFYVGVGGAMISIGVIVFPYHPLAGGALVVGGVYQEVQGFVGFVDWVKAFAELQNQIKDFNEEY